MSSRAGHAVGVALILAALMTACGGDGGHDRATGDMPRLGSLSLQRLEVAQTHLLPDGVRVWAPPTPANASESLHLVGAREALALVQLSAVNAEQPVLEGLIDGRSLGTVPLLPPSQLPATEAGGPAYATDLHSALLPAAWLKPGLSLRAKAANYSAGEARAVEVGADMPFTVRVLPF